jgi:hypothetical protein
VPYDASTTFHRLVVDESHLMESGSGVGSWTQKAFDITNMKASFVWGATGTPFSMSIDMLSQSRLIGHHSSKLSPSGPILGEIGDKRHSLQETADTIKKGTARKVLLNPLLNSASFCAVMIRHTKSQRIGGEVALALPEADCQTVWLEMVRRSLLKAQLVSSPPQALILRRSPAPLPVEQRTRSLRFYGVPRGLSIVALV